MGLLMWGCSPNGPPSKQQAAQAIISAGSKKANPAVERDSVGEEVYNSAKAPQAQEGASAPSTTGDPFRGLSFMADGIPSSSSDQEALQIRITADPKVTFFSYKLGTPADCLKGDGYKVMPISETPSISISDSPPGTLALCLLAFYEPTKQWQALSTAKVLSWQKVVFHRIIHSEYSEYDEGCAKNVVTKAEIEFSDKIGTYKWIRDARTQGCDQDTTSGKDAMTITSNGSKGIQGFWTYAGAKASGWYNFQWGDKERTKFKGNFGYGDPTLKPSGYWNSISQ